MSNELPEALDETEIAFAGVAGMAELLAKGAVTSPQLIELSLSRIARLAGLNAFVTVFAEQARAEAAAAQTARDAGDGRPLLGVPVAIKDNIPIAGHASRHGTSSPEKIETADAEFVRRLREAGLVIVGTTAMPELALWPFTESQTKGATRNPWVLSRGAGGSSGGSAAAVAAGLVPAATADDGGGSIRIPAACCGLVGLKPQRDRVAPPRNLTGQPVTSVPAGFAPDGSPLAVQLVARAGEEATVLSLAKQLESAGDWTGSRPPMAVS